MVLEAQAAGLAVVAFDQAAAGQHIRHGHNGVLAAPGDKSGFVEVASWLLDDQERLRRVRLNARQHASRQGWDSIVEHFQNYLEDACASPLVQPARSKPERPPAEDGGPCHAAASRSQAKAFGAAMKPRLMAPAPRLMPPVGLSMPRCKWMSRSRQAFSSAAKPGRSRSAVGSPA